MFLKFLAISTILLISYCVADKKYEPTWESIDSRPIPDWYDYGKIGVFLHFGVYSAASFGNEWIWTYFITEKRPEYVNFIKRTQRPRFTYQEFASEFRLEHFNASEWAAIFNDAGAHYVVLTSKHHEGYTLWPSSYSYSWNSMDIGPKRDIIKELSEAVRAQDMKFGLYYSLYEWYNPMYLEDKKNGFFETTYVDNKVIPELKELVNKYKPEIIWADGDWEAPYDYWKSREFIAWLYNESPVKDTVVTNDRWGIGTACKHGGILACYDRWNPGKLIERKFENAMTIDKHSWGHRSEAVIQDFYTREELIKDVVSTVAINGNININIGPTKYGTIETIYADRLKHLGIWLRLNGKAIYGTRPWLVAQKERDLFWFTMRAGNTRDSVFVFVLQYPYDDNFVIVESLGKAVDQRSFVKLIGYDRDIKHESDQGGLKIIFPEKRVIDKAGLFAVWTFEVDIPKAS